jgi:trans-aconitate methyltransferase
MIEFAQKEFPPSRISNLEFQICDARAIHTQLRLTPRVTRPAMHYEESKPSMVFDLVFSNAALHWVDDHEAILRGAAAMLKPGGRLVISCGGQGNAHDVFLVLRPEMRLQRWRSCFRRIPVPYFFYSPRDYEKWLPKAGFKINAVKLAPKDATYAGADGFAAWMRTTWLPYVQRVPENMREEFIAAVTRRYVAKHPPDAEGKIHVRMVRLEIDAEKMMGDA